MAKPLLINSRKDFDTILLEAFRRTRKIADADPLWELPKRIRAQIDFLANAVKGGRVPTAEEKSQIELGPIAVRNFEEGDPHYADLLKELDYAFSRWEELP